MKMEAQGFKRCNVCKTSLGERGAKVVCRQHGCSRSRSVAVLPDIVT